MSKKRKPIKVYKKLKLKDDNSRAVAAWRSNLKPNDVIQYLVTIGGRVTEITYFKVTEVGNFFVQVKYKDGEAEKEGTFSYKQLLGEVLPAPKNQVITHFSIISQGNNDN